MKLILLRIISVVALAALAGGCNQEDKDREAIIKVFQARLDARDKSTVIFRVLGKDVRRFEGPRLLHNLKQIDVSDCPDEFQAAWLGYVQTWERYAAPSPIERKEKEILSNPTSVSLGGKLDGHAGLGSGIGGSIEGHYDSAHENNAKLVEVLTKEDTSEAFRQVETLALKFKVEALKYE